MAMKGTPAEVLVLVALAGECQIHNYFVTGSVEDVFVTSLAILAARLAMSE